MNTLVISQTQVFLIFIFCGCIIGLLFDMFRILRKTFKTPDIITYIEDIVFWLLTCIILAYTILKYNNGELRLFVFIGLFIGITLYILLISNFIINTCVKFINIIKSAFEHDGGWRHKGLANPGVETASFYLYAQDYTKYLLYHIIAYIT